MGEKLPSMRNRQTNSCSGVRRPWSRPAMLGSLGGWVGYGDEWLPSWTKSGNAGVAMEWSDYRQALARGWWLIVVFGIHDSCGAATAFDNAALAFSRSLARMANSRPVAYSQYPRCPERIFRASA